MLGSRGGRGRAVGRDGCVSGGCGGGEGEFVVAESGGGRVRY